MALESATIETIMFVPVSSASIIDIVYPELDRLSSPPMSGTFYVSCYNIDGNRYDTQDMDISSVTAKSFKKVLEDDCGFLKGKVSV